MELISGGVSTGALLRSELVGGVKRRLIERGNGGNEKRCRMFGGGDETTDCLCEPVARRIRFLALVSQFCRSLVLAQGRL